ncbi:hypothetical protein JYU29_08120 [Tianweitania sp. BSSL-BM11]|uniref:Hydroxyquinol 1,2-dioxygenase n=1 Tax=Tianweitania aestuarii TaxID=2814886 RepID=A0ABS5RUH4_9HYPH|nr:hypothetical protein [Tianweitania aestuarii]MBS9720649.1 hypothetical protein [Tianweitania aestuarii]
MNTKILAIAAAALAISAGAASAQVANTARQGHAAPFDQGGVFNRQVNDTVAPAYGSYDRMTTASTTNNEPRTIRSSTDNPTGVPSDTRNESGLGLFDRVSK